MLRWGEPRETIDVDLTLLTGFGGEEPFVRALLARFEPRVQDPLEFAKESSSGRPGRSTGGTLTGNFASWPNSKVRRTSSTAWNVGGVSLNSRDRDAGE